MNSGDDGKSDEKICLAMDEAHVPVRKPAMAEEGDVCGSHARRMVAKFSKQVRPMTASPSRWVMLTQEMHLNEFKHGNSEEKQKRGKINPKY